MSAVKSTPMLRQYLAIKAQVPDAILFYRMGDFYEMFFQDAETASQALEITLTSRNKKDESPVPMCGVPHRAAAGYIARLIERGFKVAVCDQVEDPAEARGLVRREVVRVITPGMVVDEELLDARSHTFILAAACSAQRWGLACLDLSTGAFRTTESDDCGAIVDEARRLAPREILLPESVRLAADHAWVGRWFPETAVTYLEERAFDLRRGRERLAEQFGTLTLEGFGCEGFGPGLSAAGAVLHYVAQTQKQRSAHLTRIEPYTLDHALAIDEVSRQNLELARNLRTGSRRGTLIGVLDQTRTPMGARLLQDWLRSPLREAAAIEERLEAVGELKEKAGARRGLRERLKTVYDLERLNARTVMGRANARDLVALKRSLQALPAIWAELAAMGSALLQPVETIDALAGLAELIEAAVREDAPPTLNEGGLIRTGYNVELDELARVGSDAKGFLARLEAAERERTGIATLKVGYNKVFGYYIEVSRARAAAVPPDYVRKQTLVNAERYITDELKRFETLALGAEERRVALELRLFQEVRDQAAGRHPAIRAVAERLAAVDCLLGLAEAADHNGYCRPRLLEEGAIRIEDGRHPVVEKMITGERYVPNSVALDDVENQVLVITGPNMAGKSTVLRQVALTVIMAQMGSFVPARRAEIGLVDRIFTRVGALDNLSHGQSTFMVEMQETANILNNAGPRSLVVLDEIGRGTSTFDGLSIAWAVAEHLHDLHGHGVKALFATHYHELTALAERKPRVKNFNIAVKEWNDEIIFLRQLVPGGTNRSYGIQVARLAGIPAAVIDRAKKILYGIENGEHAFAGGGRAPGARAAPVQLDLFRGAEHQALERLRALDIAGMTPLDALNCLSQLQALAGAKADGEALD